MGKLIYSMSVSLDGFAATPTGSLDWVDIDEELHEAFDDEAEGVGTMLFGRRMWEVMAAYWPTAETDPTATPAMRRFARIWRDTAKVVFSRTLEHVDRDGRLVRDDAVAQVARLKAEEDRDLSVGGPTLAATFLRAGLVDEVRIYVHPVVIGAGLPFFPPLPERVGLRLLETRTFSGGVVYLRYEVAGAAR
jgi:dihydrofolate reductase